ncbi:hypothetical protein ENBRE01_1550 [Enteropsectra breve]|nr:hypothetical protein ENBRE01_1550 [Enteropsectra breve]
MKSIKIHRILVFSCMISAFRQYRRTNEGTNIPPFSYAPPMQTFYDQFGQPYTIPPSDFPYQVFNPINNVPQFPLVFVADPNAGHLQPNPSVSHAPLHNAGQHVHPYSRDNQRNKYASSSSPQNTIKKDKSFHNPAANQAVSQRVGRSAKQVRLPMNRRDIQKKLKEVRKNLKDSYEDVELLKARLQSEQLKFNEIETKVKKELSDAETKMQALEKQNSSDESGAGMVNSEESNELEEEIKKLRSKLKQTALVNSIKGLKNSFEYNSKKIEKLKETEAELRRALGS